MPGRTGIAALGRGISSIRSDLERAGARAGAHQVPLFLSEFGATAAAPMADRSAWTALVRAEAERVGFAWCYGAFATEFGARDIARGDWQERLRAALLGTRRPDARVMRRDR